MAMRPTPSATVAGACPSRLTPCWLSRSRLTTSRTSCSRSTRSISFSRQSRRSKDGVSIPGVLVRRLCRPGLADWQIGGWADGPLRQSGDPSIRRSEEKTMRFMVIVKASPESEAGRMPTEKELTEMGNFNDELIKAGVMLAGEGLQASSKGARVRFDKG